VTVVLLNCRSRRVPACTLNPGLSQWRPDMVDPMEIAWLVSKALIMVSVIMGMAAYAVLLERKVAAAIQGRPGPTGHNCHYWATLPIIGRILTRLGSFPAGRRRPQVPLQGRPAARPRECLLLCPGAAGRLYSGDDDDDRAALRPLHLGRGRDDGSDSSSPTSILASSSSSRFPRLGSTGSSLAAGRPTPNILSSAESVPRHR
jgi:hypothetical protein